MEPNELIASRKDWFHSIDFGHGLISPGIVPLAYLQRILTAFQLPKRLDGMRVLDIGTYDGFWAFECERRGAAEVVAIDVNPIDFYCFHVAHTVLKSRVRYHEMSVYALDEQTLGGKFDLILFPGVFYHLRHFLISLDQIWERLKPNGILLMESHVCDGHFVLADGTSTTLEAMDPRLVKTPLFRFYRRDELNKGDWSNWFGGNVAAILDCLGSAGFEAKHLASWSVGEASRAAFEARKIDLKPREWEHGSYEGMSFQKNADGSWTLIWHDPKDLMR